MTTAAEVVELLKDAVSGAPGVTRIKVDGMEIDVDRKALDYWERRAAREASPNRRPISSTIDLSNF